VRHLSFSQTKSFSQELVDRLGINFIQPELPDGLELYARSPDFIPSTLPAELKKGHYTAEGVWGVIRVLEGAVDYALEAPSTASLVLHEGESAVIEPQTLHHLHFVGRGRFFIEFHLTREKMNTLRGCGAC
jgi:tellurite resistance-related uncharacterized protein